MIVLPLIVLGAFAVPPILSIAVYHYNVLLDSLFLGMEALFMLPFLWAGVKTLSRRTIVLDRLHNRVSLGDKAVCDLSDVRRVEMNKYFFALRKGSARMTELRLKTLNGDMLTLLGSVSYSLEEVEEIGREMAAFAGLEFACVSAES